MKKPVTLANSVVKAAPKRVGLRKTPDAAQQLVPEVLRQSKKTELLLDIGV